MPGELYPRVGLIVITWQCGSSVHALAYNRDTLNVNAGDAQSGGCHPRQQWPPFVCAGRDFPSPKTDEGVIWPHKHPPSEEKVYEPPRAKPGQRRGRR
jgi:hypothetical protein